eukprot:CAMPEP_0167789000 /NCGR_PEP_ID=MMETSP0111_2-20121227/10405_1 /TAXON_ID=91324 /ORGANISM="Lotharella globosa, Strain CCCM811" /LENGTH=156 /DNA_ID=CAMNT_0007681045 /DNA_START=184 /DNA_END=654 /DNA_ORIENTATION=-
MVPDILMEFAELWPLRRKRLEDSVKADDHKTFLDAGLQIKQDAIRLCLRSLRTTCDSVIGLAAALQQLPATEENVEKRKKLMGKRGELVAVLEFGVQDVTLVAKYLLRVQEVERERKSKMKAAKMRSRQCRTSDVLEACRTRNRVVGFQDMSDNIC